MTDRTDSPTKARTPLTRERVLDAGIALADKAGLDGLTMRALGTTLGVEAMSLYNHVDHKNDLLDGMVDRIVGEIELPGGPDWRAATRRRLISAHEVFLKHPWVCGAIQSRPNPGAAALQYLDATRSVLREAGFPEGLVDHAWNTLEAYLHGFTLQRPTVPRDPAGFPFGLDLILDGLVRSKNRPVA